MSGFCKRLWFVPVKGQRFRYIAASGPCWKGEIIIPWIGCSLCIGWQR